MTSDGFDRKPVQNKVGDVQRAGAVERENGSSMYSG